MKKLQLGIAVILLAATMASCHKGRHTTIVMRTNNVYLKVEYAGFIAFTDDKTAIQSMSPGAYFKYNKNGEQLVAECDWKGNITYELYNGGKTTVLDNEGKQILIQAIKFISGQQLKQRTGHI